MNKLLILSMVLTALVSFEARCDQDQLKKTLEKQGLEIDAVTESSIPGLYEVMAGPRLFYVSKDGKFLVLGKMYDSVTREDLSEKKIVQARIHALDKVGLDKMVVFKPDNPKYSVSIFTDIDCGYCRKLHGEIDQYMKEGIEVRYLFFPRAGPGSESYNKAVAVWCSKDRNKALTAAKKGEKLETKTCDNPVIEHLELGADFDMRGTPMIVTENGTVMPGYVPAKQLVKILQAESDKKKGAGE